MLDRSVGPPNAGTSDGGTSFAGAVGFFGGATGTYESSTFQLVADFDEATGSASANYMCSAVTGGCMFCPPISAGGGTNHPKARRSGRAERDRWRIHSTAAPRG